MKSQRGSAAVLAVLTMLFIGIIIGGVLPMLTNEMKMGTMNKDMVEAEYAAEGGAKRAIAELSKASTSWGWLGVKDGTQNYTVTLNPTITNGSAPVTGNYTVTSVGNIGNVTKTVTVNVAVTRSLLGNAGDYPIYAGGNIVTKNNNVVEDGDVASGGTITGNFSFNDPQYSTREGVAAAIPSYSRETYKDSPMLPTIANPATGEIDIGGTYYMPTDYDPTQNTKYNVTSKTTIYINGDLGSQSQKGGDVNGLSFTGTGHVLLIVNGNIYLKNNFTVISGVVVCYGNADTGNNFTVDGSMIVKGTLDVNYNNVTATYNADVVNDVGIPTTNRITVATSNWKTQ